MANLVVESRLVGEDTADDGEMLSGDKVPHGGSRRGHYCQMSLHHSTLPVCANVDWKDLKVKTALSLRDVLIQQAYRYSIRSKTR